MFAIASSNVLRVIMPRPSYRTIDSLRATLQEMELTPDPGQDQAAMEDLKRVLLNRIAELELVKKLEAAEPEEAKPSQPSDLIPPTLAAEASAQPDSRDPAPLEKLD